MINRVVRVEESFKSFLPGKLRGYRRAKYLRSGRRVWSYGYGDAFAPAKARETIFRYDPGGWKVSDRQDCSRCEYSTAYSSERGITVSSDNAAGARAIACLELRK